MPGTFGWAYISPITFSLSLIVRFFLFFAISNSISKIAERCTEIGHARQNKYDIHIPCAIKYKYTDLKTQICILVHILQTIHRAHVLTQPPWMIIADTAWLLPASFSRSMHTRVLKSSAFWDITPYSPLNVNQCFGGTCRTNHLGRRISQARNLKETNACHLLGLFFDPDDGGDTLLRNVRWLSTDYTSLYPEDRTLHKHRCENLPMYLFASWLASNAEAGV
jgi:hypothetical protein